jgi:hypothetical protein
MLSGCKTVTFANGCKGVNSAEAKCPARIVAATTVAIIILFFKFRNQFAVGTEKVIVTTHFEILTIKCFKCSKAIVLPSVLLA